MRKSLLFLFLALSFSQVFATGEPSTYFQIFVPPNNDPVRRDASLIITAIYDSTSFTIIDDGMDGDTDDSKTGILMAGQSYVLYIRDNGINDDARYASGGVLKWDGDYFIVKSDKLVFASQSTNSDWQHDWVPSTDKKSIGQKFILYSPPFSSSKRDVNVFAYENNTTVSFQKISFQPKTNTGFTDVNIEKATTVFRRTLNIGEDIIYKYPDGRDVMEAGETYMIVSDKPITVQYGSLFGNERDGGGYVPSSNGSSSGSLMLFAVPFQSNSTGEQEIRIVSWDDANTVNLERFVNGSWVLVKTFALKKMQAGDWVGKTNGNVNYPNVFRVTCSNGKRVSVFEGNWFETGSPGTSDMGTMVSAENGTSSGKKFLTYMAPPGNEANVINPFTSKAFGQQLSHLYLFAKKGATVTVKDAYTNGTKFNKTFIIGSEKYADCFLTVTEWKNIYNGTGTPVGPERPYLIVESDEEISVMNTNFNDNWMCYVGSSLAQAFTQIATVSQSAAIPTDTIQIRSVINIGSLRVDDPKIEVIVEDGLRVIESTITTPTSIRPGDIFKEPGRTIVSFETLPVLNANAEYEVNTKVVASVGNNTGGILTSSINSTIETILTGSVDGQIQQASSTEVVNINPTNTSKLFFSRFADNLFSKDSTDSWTVSWVDINKDGYDDLFVTDKRPTKPNLIYINNRSGGFTRGQSLITDTAISMTNTWADIDNDGDEDLLVLNNTRKTNTFYRSDNGNLVKDNNHSFTANISYYHGGSFADYDNDGKVDLFMCNYFPTKYNELHRNNGNGQFVMETANTIPAEANQSVGASWADYDGDGFIDLFVPNGNGFKNSLFHNEGNGTFTKASNVVTSEGGQSVGSCWGDVDNDGDLDLFVTNSNTIGNFFYKNDGNGKFTKITTGEIVTDRGTSHGCSFADIDNDGDLDLFVSNDKSFKFLYINNGDGSFIPKTDEVINFNFGNAFGHAWSDFDRDGDLDLVAATHSNQPNALFINNGNSGKWVEVKLVGTVSNKSGIGADIFVYSNGVQQMREVNSQSGFGGQGSLTQHFGLGSAAVIDSIKVKWPSGIVQMLYGIQSNQFINIVEAQSVKVRGGVYFDSNDNGRKDQDEPVVGRASIKLTPGDTKLYTNNDGAFSIYLIKGNYGLSVIEERGIKPASGSVTSLTVEEGIDLPDTVWLAAKPVCTNADMELVMGSTAIRKGYTNNQFTLIISNNGRVNANLVDLKLKMPAKIILGTPSTPFSGVASTTIEEGINYKIYSWRLDQMKPFDRMVINFSHGTDASVNIGDVMNIEGWIEGVDNDCNPSDNSLKQSYKVFGAIDPNDMQVSPVGYGKEGFIKADQVLTYTVRFQNIGNHAANTVKITDQLPEGLDMSSLRLVAQSHPDLFMKAEGNNVLFQFDDIMLPDSTSNVEGSNGHLVFTIRPKAGIAAGTKLANKASIQFDNYEAVITNEVLNTIQSRSQEEQLLDVKAYPNPAADVVYLKLEHKMGRFTNRKIAMVEMIDMNGRIMMTKKFTESGELRIDLPVWLNGFYYIRITDNENNTYIQRLLIRKNR